MNPHEDQDDPPKFEGEDTRPTSRKELWGWYSYGWAAETFVIVCMSSLLPITLEQLARENGVLLKDKTTSCQGAWKEPPDSSEPELLRTLKHKELPACVVNILGAEINTASFAMYTFSISVLVQALLIISMSGAADHGRFRKTFLLAFALIGSISTMLFIGIVPKVYLLGALLAVIANTCFGASFVLLNSFLPLLVRQHPAILRERADHYHETDHQYADDHEETPTAATSLLPPYEEARESTDERTVPAIISPELQLSTRISSYGIGIGYTAGLLVQCICIFIIVATGSTTFSLRLALFIAGAWWFFFSIPAALWLRPRPGPPLPSHSSSSWYSYITYAWRSLFRTISHARKLRDILIFLAAWFLLSDSIATVSGTAVLFAKTTLGMSTASLGLINVIATIAGVLGAFSWSLFSRTFDLKPSQTIVACITLFELIPLYGLLGFIPAIQRLGMLGLQQPWEMYPVGAVYGFVLGGLSSYCRAFFGELIPPGYEAAFYALYAITDKGSSIFGPAVVGAITDRYGEIRPAFVFLAVLIGLPLPLMMLLDVDRGRRDAKTLGRELEEEAAKKKNGTDSHAGYGTVEDEHDRVIRVEEPSEGDR